MAKKFLTNIDLNKNELQSGVIHKLATAPSSPSEGQVYYHTGDERIYIRLNSVWKDISGLLDNITTTTTAVSIGTATNGEITLDISNADGIKDGLMSTAHFIDLTNATNLATASTVAKRDASANAVFNELTAVNFITSTAPTLGSHLTNKTYVDNLVAGGVIIMGVIDASTNPDYPAAARIGESWFISVPGKIGGASGPDVQIGDMILATAVNAGGDHATVGGDWEILQTNTTDATEVIAGVIRIATQAETDTGTLDTAAVTPLKMATYVADHASAPHSETIGNGAMTTIVVNHAKGTTDVLVSVHDTLTGEEVEPTVFKTDANNVTLDFNVAPTLNQYTVVIR